MRQIDRDAAFAFLNGKDFKSGNTEVKDNELQAWLVLHGSPIALKTKKNGKIEITNAEYPTQTTKARLNAIPGVSIVQRAGKWFLNDEEWNGEWTTL